MRVHVEGYGCPMNLAEAGQIRGFLKQSGWMLAESPEQAELLILHSCGVKDIAENRMKNRLAKLAALAEQSNGRVIVSGCLPAISAKALSEVHPNIEIGGTGLESIATLLGLAPVAFSPEIPNSASRGPIKILPVSRGCLSACSFCATRLARGKLESYPLESIQNRFRAELKNGAREIWLTGQDLGCWGMDRGQNVCDLVESLLQVPGDYRVRIGMSSPQYLSRYFERFVRLFDDSRLYRFVHLPVQSGSNRVLAAMRRSYSREYFLDLAGQLRRALGDFTLATDIIVGFPGETVEDFEQSWSLVESARPSVVNVSRFGARPGTVAAAMPNGLHGRDKKRRSTEFMRRFHAFGLAMNQAMTGRVEQVLVNESNHLGHFTGRTNTYTPVIVADFKGKLGDEVCVQINAAGPHFVRGSVLKAPKTANGALSARSKAF